MAFTGRVIFYKNQISPLILKEEFSTEISDDTCCDICGYPDASNANAIIFCDRCDVAVHQECYGVPSIPEGRWLCTRCGLIPNSIVSCALCPHYEGAIKPTEEGNWSHIACAHYIEETGFSNETYLEPIIGISRISPSRLKLKCFLCKVRYGAPIQCASKHCNVSFHVRCAQLANLSMDYVHKRVYCPRHTPNGPRSRIFAGIEINAPGSTSTDLIRTIDHQHFLPRGFNIQKSSCDKARSVLVPNLTELVENQSGLESVKISQLSPMLPEVLFTRIMDGEPWKDRNSFPWKKILDAFPGELEPFLRATAKYWSLKRDFKGVPLIRRLYLENINSSNSLSEEALEEIIQKLRGVRFQLEMIRSLIELNKRVFELKLKDLQQIVRVSNLLKAPTYYEQKDILEVLKAMDKQKYFRDPVSIEYVPDYLDIIKNPMDFGTMESKLTTGAYFQEARTLSLASEGSTHEAISLATWETFKRDFELICSNAMTYNAPKTRWYKAAENLKSFGLPFIRAKEQIFLYFLQKNIDWLQDPIPAYLQIVCQHLCPYSNLSEEELLNEEKYGNCYKRGNPYSLIDVMED